MKSLLTFVLLAALAAGAWLFVVAPFGPSAETFVDIPTGTGTTGIARRLADAHVIRSAFSFELLRKLKGGRLKAGVYRFDHAATPAAVYARLARGDVYTIALSIPEGFNIFDIAAAVDAAHLAPAATFLAAERADTALIHDLSPHATSLEGFLFPDTYRFSPHTTPAVILAAMVHRFRQEASAAGVLTAPDPARTVLIASLIEKEVRFDNERPVVAGVFRNRLALNMPLQTDPTVIYAALLDNRWRGTIYQSDLQSDSLYNTYRHAGLPPGPIANPGLAALRAALHPAQTDNLYFVADSTGHTAFSRDLATHAVQVQALRQGLAQTPTQTPTQTQTLP